MVRFVIIGIVVAVAFTLYALVDAVMTDGSRARGVAKPVWVLIIVVLPVIGAVLWFMIGRGAPSTERPIAPDDDPRFTGSRVSKVVLDEELRELEDRLRELDDEVFPGEDQVDGQESPKFEQQQTSTPDQPTPQPASDGTAEDRATQDTGAETPEGLDPEAKPNSDGDAGAARK